MTRQDICVLTTSCRCSQLQLTIELALVVN